METKTFEIRDRLTFIPVLAIQLSPAYEGDRYLISRAGFGKDPELQATYIICVQLSTQKHTYEPEKWGDRTMTTAHQFIKEHFSTLPSAAVIDVEYILGETKTSKESERISVGY